MDRNVGSQSQPRTKADPAYRTNPPVYNPNTATDVCKRLLTSEITVTQGELFSMAPELRNQVREAITAKRTFPPRDPVQAAHYTDYYNSPQPVYQSIERHTLPTPPPGATIIPDPFETYLRQLPPG
jgi:3-methyladenine DNA glycosylase/8-oxoguanine DNA glycosylase